MGLQSSMNDLMVALGISKNGFGKAIEFTKEGVARSAAYNKVSKAANDIINTMGTDEAQTVRKIIKEGKDFGTKEFEDALAKMSSGDDAAKKIAEEFSTLRGQYDNAMAKNTVEGYAEFLGKNNGNLGISNVANGYFFDKENGKARRIVAAGVAAGVGVTGRYLSGGSLTRTNTGERDIAGVPFI